MLKDKIIIGLLFEHSNDLKKIMSAEVSLVADVEYFKHEFIMSLFWLFNELLHHGNVFIKSKCNNRELHMVKCIDDSVCKWVFIPFLQVRLESFLADTEDSFFLSVYLCFIAN
jgi:hypothetical protein